MPIIFQQKKVIHRHHLVVFFVRHAKFFFGSSHDDHFVFGMKVPLKTHGSLEVFPISNFLGSTAPWHCPVGNHHIVWPWSCHWNFSKTLSSDPDCENFSRKSRLPNFSDSEITGFLWKISCEIRFFSTSTVLKDLTAVAQKKCFLLGMFTFKILWESSLNRNNGCF